VIDALPTPDLAAATPAGRARAPAQGLVPSVTRALALLDLLAEERAPMGLARLASSLGLPKSSVHALCNTLLTLGYLRRQGEAGFFIGPRVMPLADAFVSGTDVAQSFNLLWDEMGAPPEETVILSVLNGTDVVYIAARSGVRPLGLAFRVGMRLPAHLAASGRAMLAFLPPAAVRTMYAGFTLSPPAHGPALTLDALLVELDHTRQRGYSVDDEGVREGVHCIGAPVFDAGSAVVAGVGVCIQKAVVDAPTRAKHRDTVLRVAGELSQRLGGRPPVVHPTA
jgi:IclR family transcriptional regulator, blcABC operon repressor